MNLMGVPLSAMAAPMGVNDASIHLVHPRSVDMRAPMNLMRLRIPRSRT